jgi:hypothetical protein
MTGSGQRRPALSTWGAMARAHCMGYRSVQVLHGTTPNARRKLLEHEAEDDWAYVTNVAIGDDENLVFKKSA